MSRFAEFVPLLVLLGVLPVVVLAILALDDLVYLQKTRYEEDWARDGSPMPVLKRRSASRWNMRSWLATQVCGIRWVFVTPVWVRADPEGGRLLRRYRLLLALWCFAAMPAFVLVSILSTVISGQ